MPGDVIATAIRLAKQAAAGAAENYDTPMKRVPGIGVDPESGMPIMPLPGDTQPPTHLQQDGLPGMLTNGISGLYKLAQAGTDLVPKKYLPYRLNIPALEAASQNSDRVTSDVNSAIGIDSPHNVLEAGARIGGNIFSLPELPLPKVPGHNLGSKVANTAIELAAPGRQGSVAHAAMAAGAGAGIQEGIGTVAENIGHPLAGYNTIQDYTTGPVQDQLLQAHPQHQPGEYITGDDRLIYDAATRAGDEDTMAQIEGSAIKKAGLANSEAYLPPKPDWKEPAIAAGILGAAALAGTYSHGLIKSTMEAINPNPGSLMGLSHNVDTLSGTDKILSATVQHDQPIRAMEKTMAQGDALKQRLAALDQVTAPALNSKLHHFAMTGEVPGSSVRVEAPAPMLEEYAGLTPPERQVVAEGLLAKSAMDDYQRTGTAVQFHDLGIDPSTGQFNNATYGTALREMVQRLDGDSKLSGFADRFRSQYRSMLDYNKEAGITSAENHEALTTARPNYVPIHKNTGADPIDDFLGSDRPTSPPTSVMFGLNARSEEEGGGVKLGQAADPVQTLMDEWTRTIRNGEINGVRRDVLSRAVENDELAQNITRMPAGEAPKGNATDYTTVFEDGHQVNYLVKDKNIARALELNPFATRGALSALVGAQRKAVTYGATGPGSLLYGMFAPKAAAFDAFLGSALKPKDLDMGMTNELINKLVKNPDIADNPFLGAVQGVLSRIDPTGANPLGVMLNVPIGTVRGIWDDTVHTVSNALAKDLADGDGLFSQILGPDKVQALQVRAAQAFENSVKMSMMKSGDHQSSFFGSTRPDSLSSGLESVAPKFSAMVASQQAADAFGAAVAGDGSKLEAALKVSKAPMVALNATKLGQMMSALTQNIHESFRYQVHAANMGKFQSVGKDGKPYINDEALQQVVGSQVRRIAGDVGQTGGSRVYQELTNGIAYSNNGVQAMAQVGRMFRDQPVTTFLNVSGMLGTTMALYLAGLYMDPSMKERVGAMTPEQKIAAIPMPGGLNMPLPQEARPLFAPLMAIADEITGMNDKNPDGTVNFNQNFGKAMMQWLDHGTKVSDENKFEYHLMQDAAIKSLNPFDITASPAFDTQSALLGMDAGRSQLSGMPQAIQSQQVSGLGGQGQYTDDLMSAQAQKIIQGLIGNGLFGMVRAGMDADRATTGHDATKVFLSRMEDNFLANKTNLAGQIWGQNYDRALPKGTLDSQLFYAKQEGIKSIADVSNKDYWSRFTTTKDPRNALVSVQDVVPPNLQGTQAEQIIQRTAIMHKATDMLTSRIHQITIQMANVDSLHDATIQDRNEQKNKLLAEREGYQQQVTNIMHTVEDGIRQSINDPTFTFQDFDKNKMKYAKTPVAVSSPPEQQPLQPGVPQQP